MKLFLFSTTSFFFIVFTLIIVSVSFFGFRSQEENIFIPDTLAGYSIDSVDIFNDYQNWTSSDTFSADDKTVQAIMLLSGASLSYGCGSLSGINGDGLADVIFSKKITQGGTIDYEVGIFLNTGGHEFDLVYKCVVRNSIQYGDPTYYGDCAG
jgi:hypothetical protein